MQNDIYNGKYSQEEVKRILEINSRPDSLKKPQSAFYQKSATEIGPSWAEKREFCHWLINDSTVSPASKKYLREQDHWVGKYQLRGFKYGLASSTFVFFCFPVIRKQTFVRRFACSMVPMAYFMNWGYVWGHENWWRRAKEVIVTYEIYAGTRDKYRAK